MERLEDFHIFQVDFITSDGIKGYLAKTCEDNVIINIAGFTLELCDIDEFNDFVTIKDNTIVIDDVQCKIVSIDKETNAEFNEFCDKCDLEY